MEKILIYVKGTVADTVYLESNIRNVLPKKDSIIRIHKITIPNVLSIDFTCKDPNKSMSFRGKRYDTSLVYTPDNESFYLFKDIPYDNYVSSQMCVSAFDFCGYLNNIINKERRCDNESCNDK